MSRIIDFLLGSADPSIRYKTRLYVLREDAGSRRMTSLKEEIRRSNRVRLLLSERGADGRIPLHPYSKWCGAHWVLSTLAEIEYPSQDDTLIPLREQVYEWLFSKEHEGEAIPHHPYTGPISVIRGRPRIHASLEGNALFYCLKLGIDDELTGKLAKRLLGTQWIDGGWNCDRNPSATNSSFTESLIPLRALALHAKMRGSRDSRSAMERASEFFLKRHLFKRIRDGRIIRDDFVKLHFPWYWHYDILFALKVMGEAGHLQDPRCKEALDLLESKRTSDGGFPSEKRYYRIGKSVTTGRSLIDWGGMSSNHMNEFVTVEALHVIIEYEESLSYLTISE